MKIFKEIGRNVYIDWIIILFFVAITTTALAFGGIYLYNAVTKGDIQGGNGTNSLGNKLDTNILSLVVSDFSSRADVTKRVGAGYSGPRDPSI